MFGRIFGRGKDDLDQAVCAQCGRTLLAGEWTQTVVDADGRELLICSLCAQTHSLSGGEAVASSATPANNGRVRESRVDVPDTRAEAREPKPEARDARSDSDAFWKALKDKDAEIERLQEQLARVEAEKQELAGRLALAGSAGAAAAVAPVPQEPFVPSAAQGHSVVPAAPHEPPPAGAPAYVESPAESTTGDSSEPGERTWGETPAEFAAELAAIRDEGAAMAADEPAAAAEQPPFVPVAAAADVAGPPSIVFEDTQPIPAISDAMIADAAASEPSASEPADAENTLTPGPAAAPVASPAAERAPQTSEPSAAEIAADAASLTLLQRGVDLLNVSRVPHKIAETNEQLGLPQVHVGFDGHTTVVTFMWSMGWYRFTVDAESGDVRMDDRGYEELTDLRPNAGVRADGTVQLAPAQIARAAQRPAPERPAEPLAAPVADAAPVEPETPRVAAQKPPEILSKSLLGQRSDDEAASWEKTQARDFDWDR